MRKAFGYERNSSVLDVGCSHGGAVRDLWRGGWFANGVDVSQYAILAANREGVNATREAGASILKALSTSHAAMVSLAEETLAIQEAKMAAIRSEESAEVLSVLRDTHKAHSSQLSQLAKLVKGQQPDP